MLVLIAIITIVLVFVLKDDESDEQEEEDNNKKDKQSNNIDDEEKSTDIIFGWNQFVDLVLKPQIESGSVVIQFDGSLHSIPDQQTGLYDLFSKYQDTSFMIQFTNDFTFETGDISELFAGCTNIVGVDFSGLRKDNIVDMHGLLAGSGVTNIQITGDFDNVEDISDMFLGCTYLSQIQMEGKMPKIKNIDNLFSDLKCSSISIQSCDFSSVTSANNLFYNCDNLSQLNLPYFSSLQNADFMFLSCDKLEQIIFTNYGLPQLVSGQGMFMNCKELQYIFLNLNMPLLQNASYMFCNCQKLTHVGTASNYDADISKITLQNLSSLTNIDSMFLRCDVIQQFIMYGDFNELQSMDGLFKNCQGVKNVSIIEASFKKLTSMKNMFQNCKNLQSVTFNTCDFPKVQDLSYLFSVDVDYDKIQLSNDNVSENQYLTSLIEVTMKYCDFSSATSIDNMFYYCQSLNSLIMKYCNFSSLKSLSINYVISLSSIDLSGSNFSSITSLNGLFKNMNQLNTVTLTDCDFQNVESAVSMFYNTYIENVKIDCKFTYTKLVDVRYMFKQCLKLKSLDLSGMVNVSKVDEFLLNSPQLKTIKGNDDIKMDIDAWDRLTLFDRTYTYTYNIVLNMNGDDNNVEFYDKVLWYSVLNNISQYYRHDGTEFVLENVLIVNYKGYNDYEQDENQMIQTNYQTNIPLSQVISPSVTTITFNNVAFMDLAYTMLQDRLWEQQDGEQLYYLFKDCSNVKYFNLYIHLSNIKSLNGFFDGCKLEGLIMYSKYIGQITVDKNTDKYITLYGYDSETPLYGYFDRAIDTITNADEETVMITFKGDDSGTQIRDTISWEELYQTFTQEDIVIENCNIVNYTNGSTESYKLCNLPIQIKSVTFINCRFYEKDMSGLFENCQNLEYVNFTDMDYDSYNCARLFDGCDNINTLGLSKKQQGYEIIIGNYKLNKIWLGNSNDVYEEQSYEDINGINNTYYVYDNLQSKYTWQELLNSLSSGGNSLILDNMVITDYDPNLLLSSVVNPSSITLGETFIIEDKSFQNLFMGCSNLQNVSIDVMNISDYTNISGMFQNCSSLETLDLSRLNFDMINEYNGFLDGCKKLRTLYVDGKYISLFSQNDNHQLVFRDYVVQGLYVKDIQQDEGAITFYVQYEWSDVLQLAQNNIGDTQFELRDAIISYDNTTSFPDMYQTIIFDNVYIKGNDISGMFKNCTNLTGIDLSHVLINSDTANTSSLFENCISLKTVILKSSYDNKYGIVLSGSNIFTECRELQTLQITKDNYSINGDIKQLIISNNLYDNYVYATDTTKDDYYDVIQFYTQYSWSKVLQIIQDNNKQSDFTLQSVYIYNYDETLQLNQYIGNIYNITFSDICFLDNNLENLFYNCQKLQSVDISGLIVVNQSQLKVDNIITQTDNLMTFIPCDGIKVTYDENTLQVGINGTVIPDKYFYSNNQFYVKISIGQLESLCSKSGNANVFQYWIESVSSSLNIKADELSLDILILDGDLSEMFQECKCTKVDLSGMKKQYVKQIQGMFMNSQNLQNVLLPSLGKFEGSMQYMFYNCPDIRQVNMAGITQVIYDDGFTGIFNFDNKDRQLQLIMQQQLYQLTQTDIGTVFYFKSNNLEMINNLYCIGQKNYANIQNVYTVTVKQTDRDIITWEDLCGIIESNISKNVQIKDYIIKDYDSSIMLKDIKDISNVKSIEISNCIFYDNSMENLFYGLSSLESVQLLIDMQYIQNINGIFDGCKDDLQLKFTDDGSNVWIDKELLYIKDVPIARVYEYNVDAGTIMCSISNMELLDWGYFINNIADYIDENNSINVYDKCIINYDSDKRIYKNLDEHGVNKINIIDCYFNDHTMAGLFYNCQGIICSASGSFTDVNGDGCMAGMFYKCVVAHDQDFNIDENINGKMAMYGMFAGAEFPSASIQFDTIKFISGDDAINYMFVSTINLKEIKFTKLEQLHGNGNSFINISNEIVLDLSKLEYIDNLDMLQNNSTSTSTVYLTKLKQIYNINRAYPFGYNPIVYGNKDGFKVENTILYIKGQNDEWINSTYQVVEQEDYKFTLTQG